MPERIEYEVLQKERCVNTVTFTCKMSIEVRGVCPAVL